MYTGFHTHTHTHTHTEKLTLTFDWLVGGAIKEFNAGSVAPNEVATVQVQPVEVEHHLVARGNADVDVAALVLVGVDGDALRQLGNYHPGIVVAGTDVDYAPAGHLNLCQHTR